MKPSVGLGKTIDSNDSLSCVVSAHPCLQPVAFSMNLRLRSALPSKQKIKITALVGLPDMGRVHRPVAALVMRHRRMPGVAAARGLFRGPMEMDAPRLG